MEELGFRFWIGLFGVCLAGAIGLFVIFMFFTHVIMAWGIFGLFIAVALGGLLADWIYSRREERRHRELLG